MTTVGRLNIASATVVLLVTAAFIKAEFIANQAASKYDISMYYTAATAASSGSAIQLYVPSRTMRTPAVDYLAGPPDANSDWVRIGRESGVPLTGGNFTYPPSAAVLMMPLRLLSLEKAFLAWRMLSLLCVIGAVYIAVCLAKPTCFSPTVAFSIVGALSFFPLLEMSYLGQMGAVLLFLWVLGTWLWSRNFTVLSALCFALGTMLKVTPILVLGVFLWRRKWKWVVAFCVWCGLLLGLGVWRLGWSNTQAYAFHVLPAMSCGLPGYVNKSLATISQNAYLGFVPLDPYQAPPIPAFICWLNKGISAGLLGVVLWHLHRRKKAPNLVYEIAMFALVALLVSPVSWRHHYVMALFPLVFLWSRYRQISSQVFLALVGTTLLLGTPFSDYLVVLLHSSPLQVLVAAAPTVAALALLLIGLREYTRGVCEQSLEAVSAQATSHWQEEPRPSVTASGPSL